MGGLEAPILEARMASNGDGTGCLVSISSACKQHIRGLLPQCYRRLVAWAGRHALQDMSCLLACHLGLTQSGAVYMQPMQQERTESPLEHLQDSLLNAPSCTRRPPLAGSHCSMQWVAAAAAPEAGCLGQAGLQVRPLQRGWTGTRGR